ncbi:MULTISPECIES: hypothetical protein [Bradyrhizobium]|uniref:hypothetical protein n=1 Tax=Bradyrhizobium centrosematis TaxID=1300039 RepID=UPI0021680839|nr:hypothetical protein [Bradyrhizobium centrosematis]MCS3765565.1 hypothetical protein [Bradyrhizobium centrosematis]MCS3778099.1 hypothetical protein [Bradyrhizobium centrosematis]
MKILCVSLLKSALCCLGLAGAIFLSIELPVFAQSADPAVRSQPSKVELAQRLSAAMSAAREKFISDFGPNAFDRADYPGGKTLGDVWTDYLGRAGYPSSLAERQRFAGILRAELDQQAALVLVMAPARDEAIEHLVVSLRRIVSGGSARLAVRQDPNGGRFSVMFGEDTSIQTTLQADDGSSYQPRSGDEIAWQFTCAGKLPDLNASVRGCYDKNYGYLMANSAKRPLESAQGRYVFQGTRSTGEQMMLEAPSGFCRPIFLELKSGARKLEVEIVRAGK